MTAMLAISATPADLRHVDTWLFDLDDTLYPPESGLGALMEPRITDLVIEATGLEREAAFALQKQYLRDHGLTLKGLMAHHGVDPDRYHARFHDVPLDALDPDPALRAALARLPGRRLIFTNADAVHARRITERLAIADLFAEVFHIASAAFEPKPSPGAFAALLRAHAVAPERACFFEDSLANLRAGKAVGMTTVLVGPAKAPGPDFIDYHATTLAPFLAAARVKEGG